MKKVIGYTKKSAAFISAAVIFFISVFLCLPINVHSEEAMPDLNVIADRIAVLVNNARAEEGLAPLYIVPYVCDIANVRSRECIESFGHNRPDGSKFSTVVDTEVLPYVNIAEDLAAGNSAPEDTFEQWRNSPKHWQYIMGSNFTHMGVGVCYEHNSYYGWYWTLLLVEMDDSHAELPGQYMPVWNRIVPKSCGDITGDGVVNTFDYITLCKGLFHEEYLNDLQIESCDVFKDGSLTIADAVVLKRYIQGTYDVLPVTPSMLMG